MQDQGPTPYLQESGETKKGIYSHVFTCAQKESYTHEYNQDGHIRGSVEDQIKQQNKIRMDVSGGQQKTKSTSKAQR